MLKIKTKETEREFSCPDFEVMPSGVRPGREHLCFPDGLCIIIEDGQYVGFYTQNPCDR